VVGEGKLERLRCIVELTARGEEQTATARSDGEGRASAAATTRA